MEAWVDTLCLLTQPKEGQQQFKNKNQPELKENLTVWKSDNQGDKEETFIQTGRRDGAGQLGGERTPGKAAGPTHLVDCGANMVGSATASRPHGPTFAHR